MLNLHEIIELENKWLAYSNKKKKKKFLILYILLGIIITCCIIFAIFYAYSKGASNLAVNVKKSNDEIKRQIDNKKVKLEKEKILENKKTFDVEKSITKDNNINQNIKKNTITLNIMDINVKNSSFQKAQENTRRQIIKSIPQDINTSNIVITNTNSKSILTKAKQDDITYIKEKFNETQSIYFALDLSKLYYSKADFKEAREWALKANKIDPKNDDSWVMFAKSSYKLGFKEQAINSLNSYLQSKDSKKIRDTLEFIKRGEL